MRIVCLHRIIIILFSLPLVLALVVDIRFFSITRR
jgi:hypothetical protein